MERHYRTKEAAELIGLAPQTLRKMRMEGRGPRFVRLTANVVVYAESALREWLEQRTYSNVGEAVADRLTAGR
jgi:predicted DNA-binding transcriptional regulator AlpA